MFLYIHQSFAISDFVAMQVKANIKTFSKMLDKSKIPCYIAAIVIFVIAVQ